MLDHISDVDASRRFLLQALSPLGIVLVKNGVAAVGLGRNKMPFFWLGTTTGPPTPVHVAFRANDHSEVDAFYQEALAAGGRDKVGPPRRHR